MILFQYPFLERISSHCGGCWTTNDRNLQFQADAILFDNTRFRKAQELHDLPDFKRRNTETQYVNTRI